MSDWFEVAFDRLYPVLYRHRDENEARRAAAVFAPRLASDGPVLDLACGSGRHMEAFAAAGLDMIGVDLSMFLLERAVAEGGQRGRVVRGDMRALPFRDGAFAGVINMFTSFGYFETDDEHRGVLDEVGRVTHPGGVFLIDYLNATRTRSTVPGRTTREQDGYTIEEDRRLVGDGRYVVKRVRVVAPPGEDDVEYDERVRLFAPEELTAMIAAAGFDDLESFGDYDGGRFDEEESDRLLILARKGSA